MNLAKRQSPAIWECAPFRSSQGSYLSSGALHIPFLFHSDATSEFLSPIDESSMDSYDAC